MHTDPSIPEGFPPHLLPFRQCLRCARPFEYRRWDGLTRKPWALVIGKVKSVDGGVQDHAHPLCFECCEEVPREEDRQALLHHQVAAC